jgi:hypothetical protein
MHCLSALRGGRIRGGVIMIFNFTKVTNIFTGLSRMIFSWLANKHNSGWVVSVGQSHQRTPADIGAHGLLVYSDAARERGL